jgi:hypothetical protein
MELSKFLVKAKIATYANVGEANERTLEDGAKELTFEDGDFKYRDRYYGFNPFIDQEVVFQNGEIVWSMNYYGKIISLVVSAKQIYEFLKMAMRQVKEDRPFRGPTNFKSGDFEYIDESNGDINDFSGTEKILFKGQEIYRLFYHGEIVKSK